MKDEQDWSKDCSDYLDSIRKPKVDPVDQFYNLLKSKLTGQVINGVLIGCLTEDELEEAYREFKG